jgi:16S rRNA U1498 N3-methylase RsmE
LIDKHYIEKLLEVAPLANIQHIYFYPSARSNLTRLSLDRFVGILTRASELAEKAWRPDVTLLDPTQGQDLIQKVRPVVMEFDPTQTLSSDIENSAVLVGPEGGWTADELAWFKQLGLTFGSLANGVLPAWIAGYSWFAK